MESEYIAHSKDLKRGITEDQSFYDHTVNVYHRAVGYLEKVKNSIKDPDLYDFMHNVLELASLLHDMGKLDEDCQNVMKKRVAHTRMLNHVDAGTAFLLSKYLQTGKNCYFFAALIVNAHHIGLANLTDIIYSHTKQLKPNSPLRDLEIISEKYPQFKINLTIKEYIDKKMEEYIRVFELLIPIKIDQEIHYMKPLTPLTVRMLLSFLVDADHSDTASNYKNAVPDKEYDLLPIERGKQLDFYVKNLQNDTDRSLIRQRVYEDAKGSTINNPIAYCCSEVGTGKTTAVIRQQLNIASLNRLSRLFFVAPLTENVSQTTRVFRKSLVLDGEDADEIIAENHCKVEYENPMARIYSTTWNSPIVVTTSVQMQTTLFSNRPSSLRKLHNLIGSGITIDEFHLAVILKNWKILWPKLVELTHQWGCKVLLVSGSTVKIWEIPELVENVEPILSILTAETSQCTLEKEKERVETELIRSCFCPDTLVEKIHEFIGPKLLVLNTIHNAAVVAHMIARKYGKNMVEHLSTALMVSDRDNILKRVRERLGRVENFTLVATSCAETGIDFTPSFKFGFRELSSFLSHIQFPGRINRAYEYENPKVFIFSFNKDCFTKNNFKDGKILTYNDDYRVSSRIFIDMYSSNKFGPEYCTEAIQRELNEKNNIADVDNLIKDERIFNFKNIGENFEAIEDNSIPIVADRRIIEKIIKNEVVTRSEFSRGVISIGLSKVEKLKKMGVSIQSITRDGLEEIKIWNGRYDADFLGYMIEIIKKLHI